jgi:hypothetical protein
MQSGTISCYHQEDLERNMLGGLSWIKFPLSPCVDFPPIHFNSWMAYRKQLNGKQAAWAAKKSIGVTT